MDIIYKQAKSESIFDKYGLKDCCFKLLHSSDIKNSIKKHHHHSEYEVHIIYNGHSVYEACGKEHKIESGYMFIIPSKMLHCLKSYSDDAMKYAITFKVDDESQIFHKNKLIFMETPSEILQMVDTMLKEYKNNLFFSHQILENCMYNITVQILRALQYNETSVCKPSSAMEDYRVSIAKQYINDNLVNNINVFDVAAHSHLSTRQLLRLFKKVENLTPSEYIIKQKIKYAEHLINSGFSLTEVGEKLNFLNQYHFNLFFKKYAGMPPGKYRKMLL